MQLPANRTLSVAIGSSPYRASFYGRLFNGAGTPPNFSGPADFAARLERYLGEYNRRKAHPYRWTYAGEPLVRGTPFEQTRRQEQEGRAWVGAHRPLWQRMIYPPRPYKRKGSPTG